MSVPLVQCRRKNDPLDFVALMERQEAEAQAPDFELMPRREAGAARRPRRAKPAAKTLLPEDHHYKVRLALAPGMVGRCPSGWWSCCWKGLFAKGCWCDK